MREHMREHLDRRCSKWKRRPVRTNQSGVMRLEVVGANGLEPLTPTV
jgi:hypothetical protein